MIMLSKEQILNLHNDLIKAFGGEYGVRDNDILELSIHSPFQTFNSVDLYFSVIDKISHLGFSIIKNHPFIDGNKRIGAHVILVLLELNGIIIDYTQNELINIIMDIASSKKDESDLKNWINEHIVE